MSLSAPSQVVFWIAVIIAVIGVIGLLVPSIAFIGAYAGWILVVGFVVLAGGCLIRGT